MKKILWERNKGKIELNFIAKNEIKGAKTVKIKTNIFPTLPKNGQYPQ